MVSFGPTLFFLGMVTPAAVRLVTKDMDHVGRSAGSVYAWSTAGGILGALCSGFLLLPAIPVSRICYVVAMALLVLASARWVARSQHPVLGLAATVVIALAGVASADKPVGEADLGRFRLIHRSPSFYGLVHVLEDSTYRYLLIDGMAHSAQTLDGHYPAMADVSALGTLPQIRPGGSRMLLIGLGGGDLVKLMRKQGVEITAVEIDPVVVETASRHFGLPLNDIEVAIDDGRRFLRYDTGTYDYLVLDAYSGGCPASHLFTREAFELMRLRLSPLGVVGVNIVVESVEDSLAGHLAATLRSVFPHTLAVFTGDPEEGLINVVFFASAAPLRLPDNLGQDEEHPMIARILGTLPSRRIPDSNLDGTIITDNRNLVDLLSVSTDLKLRAMSRISLPPAVLQP
ncbi:MAG: hypothetical protein GY953_23215 [bacterium]|nr:hypothetical protein [bacterium]